MGRSITAPAKKQLLDDRIAVVILAAGISRRMRACGCKSLLEVHGKPLILHQIDTIRSKLPKSDVVVVTGYESEKLIRILPRGIRSVENENYETTTVTKSALMGVRACSYEQILLVCGDLIFNENTLDICMNESAILVDSQGSIKKDKLGLVLQEKTVTYFGYDLPNKWGLAAYMTGSNVDLFKQICIETKQEVALFEVFNRMISKNGGIAGIEPKGLRLKEIDSIKDLEEYK